MAIYRFDIGKLNGNSRVSCSVIFKFKIIYFILGDKTTNEPSSFLSLFGPLYDPVKMKLNLPTEITKTIASTTPQLVTEKAKDPADNGLYTSFMNTVLVNRPNLNDPIATTPTTTSIPSASSINNIEELYMRCVRRDRRYT